VNHGGTPTSIFGGVVNFLNEEFRRTGFLYIMTEVVMIYFFAYFWTTVQFQPKEMANQLRGLRELRPRPAPG